MMRTLNINENINENCRSKNIHDAIKRSMYVCMQPQWKNGKKSVLYDDDVKKSSMKRMQLINVDDRELLQF